jgi:Icc-related predicted phosphoesterase
MNNNEKSGSESGYVKDISMLSIVHLSDTHSLHRELQNLPEADVIIHSGDISMTGAAGEVTDFVEWFGGLDYQYKIFIAGNHDFCLDGKAKERIRKFLPDNCFYLYESGVEIAGIKFWGIPYFMSYEFQSEKYRQALQSIPADTDILITHRPPLGILDSSGDIQFGCPDLLQKVLDIKPKYHLFGHIHDAYGTIKSRDTIFSNAAILNEAYIIKNVPFKFNLRDRVDRTAIRASIL